MRDRQAEISLTVIIALSQLSERGFQYQILLWRPANDPTIWEKLPVIH